MKKILSLLLLFFVLMSLVSCAEEMEHTDHPSSDPLETQTNPSLSHVTIEQMATDIFSDKWQKNFYVSYSPSAYSYEKQHGDPIDRSVVFGNPELQQAAAEAKGDLNLSFATDAWVFANRLIPAIERSGYFEIPENGWTIKFIEAYSDGVWSSHYVARSDADRLGFDGHLYIVFSAGDGHIIEVGSLYQAVTEVSESSQISEPEMVLYDHPFGTQVSFKRGTFSGEIRRFLSNTLENKDVTIEYASTRFADEELQEKAEDAFSQIDASTAEGLVEYAWALYDDLSPLNEEYSLFYGQLCYIECWRYMDGCLELVFETSEPEEPAIWYECHVFVSGEDGHIVCMFDMDDNLVIP